MGKSMQIIQTKQKILDTLALLLEKKSYDDITIGEISKLSKISRTTIYRHFENKDEIASEFMKNIFDFSSSSENIPFNELLRQRLNSLKKSNINSYLVNSIQLRKILFNIKKDATLLTSFTNLDQTTIQFISGGIGFSIRNWALSGFNQDIDELTNKITDLVNCLADD